MISLYTYICLCPSKIEHLFRLFELIEKIYLISNTYLSRWIHGHKLSISQLNFKLCVYTMSKRSLVLSNLFDKLRLRMSGRLLWHLLPELVGNPKRMPTKSVFERWHLPIRLEFSICMPVS